MCLFTVFVLMVPVSAGAEGFADLYIGFVQGQEQDLMVTNGDTSTDEKVEFEGNISTGYRIGYWSETLPYGIALEISYFRQDIEDLAELQVIPITPLLMLRIPVLKSAEFPNGEWQPYIAVGPGFFISELKPEATNNKDEQSDLGWDARGGLKKFFVHNVALFVEYRYTHFAPEFDKVIKEFDMETHHALFGLTVNF
jgi:hypothetical protein